jgi:phospholipase C
MKIFYCVVSLLLTASTSAFANVAVSSPANGATVSSSVNYVATATTTTCSTGVAAMGIYVNNSLAYSVNASSLNTNITLNPGTYYTVVQEWDNCGGATSTPITITVPGGSTQNGVVVTSPANNSTVTSPVNYVATAGTTTCPSGVAAMGIYVNHSLAYSVYASSLNTNITLNPGTYYTVVQEWDNCGGSTSTPVTVTVPGGSTQNGVVVTSPANNSTVTSPVTYAATAGTTTCPSGVAAMGIYVNSSLAYSVNGAKLSTQLNLSAGAQQTVVVEWDNCGGALSTSINITVQPATPPTVSFTATPSSITAGSSSTLNVSATNATQVKVSGTDGTSYTLQATGGTQVVSPAATTTYTAQATGAYGNTSASATVSVMPQSSLQAIGHVIFMLQENHSFDNYFGMLNPYRQTHGWNVGDDGKTYNVDGIDDKLSTISNQDDQGTSYLPFRFTSTCVDDESSAWLESYGDVSRYDFSTTRSINMDGFVHTAQGFANSCASSGTCSGTFTDMTGKRAMGYYDQGFLNYYYYMASQFAVSDRWFSPVSSKSISNRIATFTGGTTQGLVFDPGSQDHLAQLNISNIFQELDQASVSWKIYYTVTQAGCLVGAPCTGSPYPATNFASLSYSYKYLYANTAGASCTGTTQPSSVVGDSTNSFCIDPNHIAPLSTYFSDLTNSTLPSFAFIESGNGNNDEHPGSGQSILAGQTQVAHIMNSLMASPEWGNSVFFLSYDEGGGPYDHVPPVPGHSNANTDASLGSIPDISQIAVNSDAYKPCLPSGGTATLHCDLNANDPGEHSSDAPAQQGFAAQLGFRVPNLIVSPFTRKHYVSHTPMDHTAIIKFVENRFIGSSAHLTAHDAAQPNLLEFFDFTVTPWATPPTPPTPVTDQLLGYNSCTPITM